MPLYVQSDPWPVGGEGGESNNRSMQIAESGLKYLEIIFIHISGVHFFAMLRYHCLWIGGPYLFELKASVFFVGV